MTFLWPGCAAVALGEVSEGVSSSVQVLAACCPSPCERECGHQAPAVKFSHQRGPDPLPGVAQPALDLLGLGFGGLSPKVGLTRRGAVSPSATPVMQHGLPCIVRGQEWQNPSFISQGVLGTCYVLFPAMKLRARQSLQCWGPGCPPGIVAEPQPPCHALGVVGPL